jgi:hypothetical protein
VALAIPGQLLSKIALELLRFDKKKRKIAIVAENYFTREALVASIILLISTILGFYIRAILFASPAN